MAEPYFQESGVTLYHGDCREVLARLPANSVNCVVTSPPYWGLRDYGTAEWSGGLPDCDHVYNHGVQGKTGERATRTFTAQAVYKDECRKCGAVRVDSQLGLEWTPQDYIAKMVAVFREVHRVLRPDGTLWLNMGDSYSNDTKWGGTSGGKNTTSARGGYQGQRVRRGNDCDPKRGAAAPDQPMQNGKSGLKPKDLCIMPARLAIALQADGWYLRSDIIWSKPNPMPESVKDRPTKAHEYLFLLSKSPNYFYDADAIREPWTCDRDDMREKGVRTGLGYLGGAFNNSVPDAELGDGKRTSGDVPEGRNKRSVWTIPTQAYPEAHFATFPEDLVRPCILAGCPPGGIVLDPFAGSGTTLAVARALGCGAVGIELNPEYCKLAEKRLAQNVLPLAEAAV